MITRSAIKSEFIALESTWNEANWLRNLFIEIPLGIKLTPYISMLCDCQTLIAIAKNKSFNGKGQHIWLRHDIAEQLLKSGIISINCLKFEINLANLLTKSLGRKTILETSREWD